MIVVDINMPKHCDECKFESLPTPFSHHCPNKYRITDDVRSDGKLEDCPIVGELPDVHGRLIDADAFIDKLKDVSKRQKYKELYLNECLTVDDVFEAIIESLQNEGLAEGDSPTVLEASEVRG